MKKLTLLFFMISAIYFSQIQKVEPVFWWKGMKNPELQILVYGKDIAKNQIELSDGVQIKNLTKVENPNYVFITVNTNEINTSKFKINVKNGSKVLGSYEYELKARKPNSANRESYTSKDVIYLIMPDRFANGNPKNDSQPDLLDKFNRQDPNGRHGGDLRGIINNLDYLQNLGVTTLWLTPVNQDNEKKYSYHGYAQTDLYKIDGRYGTNEEYKELSAELKKRNMKLIQDYVTNHWGISHWLIQDLPMKDWIHQFPDGESSEAYLDQREKKGFKRSNYHTTTQFDTNASKIDKTGALDGWFDTTMPDINQSNQLVLKYLEQNAIWWVEYADLDGLRVDTFPYNDREAISKWCKSITDEYPKLNIVGEAWMYNPAHISFWQKDSKIGAIQNFNSNLPSVMDFPLTEAIPLAFKEDDGWINGMVKIYNSFASDFLYPDINNILVFLENHDTERFNEIFNAKPEYYRMALTLIATCRGIPQLYYGSEIGMRGQKSKGDGDIRRDFPGGWSGDAQNAFVSRTSEQKEFYDFTQKILNWRKSKEVIHTGKTMNFLPENKVFTFFRYNDKEKVMVIINNNDKPQTLATKHFAEIIPENFNAKEVISDKVILVNKTLEIPAKSSLILEIK